MLAAFIDFKRAYNRVDRSKLALWKELSGRSCMHGLKGRMVDYLRAAYSELVQM